jgi:chromosome segregation protein
MQIKELFLQGFKSFANPTRIEFDRGLNVIVGPNGSGKSNLIDAVNWLLANPPRFLRTTRNHEVIFQGSSTVSSLGMAFVEMLVCDPAQDEFSIGRRVFASSISEYLVNGQSTRYRDFKSELARRGMNSSKTRIMALGQEQLQIFFHSSPEERFHFLKSISGVEEWEEKLTNLHLKLERIKAKFQRLQERAKEVAFQVKQIEPLVEEEKCYLKELEELRFIKAVYLEKEIVSKKALLKDLINRQKAVLLENQMLEEKINSGYQQNTIKEKELETLSRRIERIKQLQEKLFMRKEVLERELYVYLTRKREAIATALAARNKLLEVEEEISALEKNLPCFGLAENKTGLLEEIKMLQQKLERHLKSLSAARRHKVRLQEKIAALVSWQRNLESDLSSSTKKLQTLLEEIVRVRNAILKEQQAIREKSLHISTLEARKGELLKKLSRLKVLEEKVQQKLSVFQEKREIADHIINLARELRSKGFTEESIEAISWLLDKLQVLPPSLLYAQDSEKTGKFFLSPHFVSFLQKESRLELSSGTAWDNLPPLNLLTAKGDLIILGGAIVIFPKRIVLQGKRSGTHIVLKKRREKLQDIARALEQELRSTENSLSKAEQAFHQQKLHCAKMEEKLKFFLDQKVQNQNFVLEREKHKAKVVRELQARERRLAELAHLEKKLQRRINQLKEILHKKQQKVQELDRVEATRRNYLSKIERLREKIEFIKKYFGSTDLEQVSNPGWHLQNSKLQRVLMLIEKLKVLVGEKQRKQNALKEELRGMREAVRSLQERLHKQERFYNSLLMRKERIQQEIQELEAERATLGNIDLKSQEFLEAAKQSPEDLKNIIKRKQQLISSLSPKQGAIKEMERLLEREQWLNEQIAGFEKLITLAQHEIQKCYAMSTYHFERFMKELQKAFMRNFAEIFESGKARLVLKKNSVETYIKLPGKRERDFVLLSSGEKALCSLCFVLALLEVAELPFALLDEADANLDHFNAQKTAKLLQSFAQQRQLIVVTHQEEVMEVAQRIIGITMENGVSKAVYLKNIDSEAYISHAETLGRNE